MLLIGVLKILLLLHSSGVSKCCQFLAVMGSIRRYDLQILPLISSSRMFISRDWKIKFIGLLSLYAAGYGHGYCKVK